MAAERFNWATSFPLPAPSKQLSAPEKLHSLISPVMLLANGEISLKKIRRKMNPP